MCMMPKTPTYTPAPAPQIKPPTYADASVQKVGEATRKQTAGLSNDSIRTSALGLGDNPTTKKTKLGE